MVNREDQVELISYGFMSVWVGVFSYAMVKLLFSLIENIANPIYPWWLHSLVNIVSASGAILCWIMVYGMFRGVQSNEFFNNMLNPLYQQEPRKEKDFEAAPDSEEEETKKDG